MSGTLTIPRLELVAAALATRIACSVLQESNIKYERSIYWSDSLATLHLIHNKSDFVFSLTGAYPKYESLCALTTGNIAPQT